MNERNAVQFKKTLLSLILACLVGLAVAAPALAFPPLPSSFYGSVQANGADVPEDTAVRALIGGKVFAEARVQIYQGKSVFSLNVPGDDSSTTTLDGGKEGDQIEFEIGGAAAAQTGVWHSGVNSKQDLSTADAAVQLATPAPSPSPIPTQTSIAAAAPAHTPTAAQPTATQSVAPAQQTTAAQIQPTLPLTEARTATLSRLATSSAALPPTDNTAALTNASPIDPTQTLAAAPAATIIPARVSQSPTSTAASSTPPLSGTWMAFGAFVLVGGLVFWLLRGLNKKGL